MVSTKKAEFPGGNLIFQGGINSFFLTKNIKSEKNRPPPIWLKNRMVHYPNKCLFLFYKNILYKIITMDLIESSKKTFIRYGS